MLFTLNTLKKKASKIFPWLIAVGIFYSLFRKYPLPQLIEAARYAHVSIFILYATAYFFFMGLMDCVGMVWLFGRFGFSTSLKKILPVRLASYLIMVLNYPAAQGMLAYFFTRTKKIPFLQAMGMIVFLTLMDLYWTISFAFVGSFFSDFSIKGIDLNQIVRMIWMGTTMGLVCVMAFRALPPGLKGVAWVRKRHLFQVFHQAHPFDYLKVLLLRLPMHLAINTSFYFIALSFGTFIPFWKVIARLPLVILVGTIPVTPGGLGTVQVATVEFFKSDVSEPILLSMSLAFVFMNYFLKAVTGSIFFRTALQYREPECTLHPVTEEKI